MKELELEWLRTVWEKAEKVDPRNERDWFDMAYGWAMGKGLTPDKALKFAIEVQK